MSDEFLTASFNLHTEVDRLMNKMNPQVDGFLRKSKDWQEELRALRAIILTCPLVEEIKWRTPCYTFEGSNVVMLGRLKNDCVLSFPKGSLLKDSKSILVKPGENTRASRVVRFTSVEEINKLKATLKAYILEAIEIEQAGLKVDFEKQASLQMPAEVEQVFENDPALKAAFETLTPGRQRGYLLHFSAAKQASTRVSRVLKCAPKILKGIGFHDY